MHEQFMHLALEEALKSGEDVPVGAVIVQNGQVIASAHNEREALQSPLAHAEMLAMERACRALHTRRLTDCTLYVTLEPCPMCAGAMVMAQLGQCVFGAYDERQGCCGSVYDLPHDAAFFHRVPCFGGVLQAECAQALRHFFERRRQQ